MRYPITLTFKFFALASQIYIRDADGNLLGYVKQKLLKLKEDINVYADEGQNRLLFNIRADRVLDFSARYSLTDHQGRFLGAVKRQGMRSIWKARYDVFDASNNQVMVIQEENGWVKVVDSLVGEIPLVGIFSGYFFHPSYLLNRTNGSPVARLKKQPAFFEGKFQIESLAATSTEEETRNLLALLTMVLLERSRG